VTGASGTGPSPGWPGPDVATGLLAQVVRGEAVESEHRGHVVVVGPDGAVRGLIGTAEAQIFARSSLKPLQAVAMVRAGLDVDEPQLALACASHNGSPEHLAVVRELLAGAGLDESHLQNTPDWPLDADEAFAARARGEQPSSLMQNCSGKHAAMLATCVAAGWDVEDYLSAEHPLQVLVRAMLEELTGVPVEVLTVDGCGAPLMSTTVVGLARAFGRLGAAGASGASSPEARVARAMAGRPGLVGGRGRDVTAFMAAVEGLVAKDGAEGVYAAGLGDGTGFALKVADGAARPRAAVLAAALDGVLRPAVAAADVLDAVAEVGRTLVLGHGVAVGEVVAVAPEWVAPVRVAPERADARAAGQVGGGSSGGVP
jgi:L-asparaginase II